MQTLYSKIIRLTDKRFEKVFLFWALVFTLLNYTFWLIEGYFGVPRVPRWYDLVSLGFCIYGLYGTLNKLSEIK